MFCKAGDQVRITTQLVDVASGNQIWADRIDKIFDSTFKLQDEISNTIVAKLPSRIQKALVDSVQQKPIETYSAYEYFLKGRWHFISSAGEDPAALTFLNKSLELDPHYALCHAVLANLYAYNVFSLGVWYDNNEQKSRSYINNAIRYGKNNPTVHSLVGESLYWLGEFEKARYHLETALRLNPLDVHTMIIYGANLSGSGKSKEGLEWIDKALLTDSYVSDFALESKTDCIFALHEYEQCLDIMLAWQSPPPHTYAHIAACHAHLGNIEEAYKAADSFREVCAKNVNFPRYAEAHGRICRLQEDKENWLSGYKKAGLLD
ncbi:MAG: adenylate cyclase [Parasphingorhabdus sp.]|jgi:adenylate cyclase